MTEQDIWQRVEQIQRFADSGDHESANAERQRLYADVLEHIAHGSSGHLQNRLLAHTALAAQKTIAPWS